MCSVEWQPGLLGANGCGRTLRKAGACCIYSTPRKHAVTSAAMAGEHRLARVPRIAKNRRENTVERGS
jgi:hypothetical protein